MSNTVFPALPADVAVLTANEFAFDLEWNDAPSLDEVCRRFGNDSNRAIVWLIRFRAMKSWCARGTLAERLTVARMAYICEAAASFGLNDQWEFDADAFCVAVEMIAAGRSRPESA